MIALSTGFRREDIRLEMDSTRTLLVRGQTCLEGLGIVSWTWHLMERSAGRRSFRRPFKIPHNVNVPSITGSFHHGVLHVQMPKLRSNRFSPYPINGSTRNRHCNDPPTETIRRPDRALIPDRAVRFPDELTTEENELGGDHVTDQSDSQRLPRCPEEEDECTILTEQSVGLHVPEGSSSDILSSQEEVHGDSKSLVEEMKEASTLSQDPQDQHQEQPPTVKLCSDPQLKEEELGEIMEEDIEYPTADHEGKALQEVGDAGNSHPINSIKSTVEEQGAMPPILCLLEEKQRSDPKKMVEEIKEASIPSKNLEDQQQQQQQPPPVERLCSDHPRLEEEVEKAIPPNNRDIDEKGDMRAIGSSRNLHPKRFFSPTKTLLSVIVSTFALIMIRKLLPRPS